jgi:hypothetical protein
VNRENPHIIKNSVREVCEKALVELLHVSDDLGEFMPQHRIGYVRLTWNWKNMIFLPPEKSDTSEFTQKYSRYF